MRLDRNSGLRARAAGLTLTLMALAAASTAGFTASTKVPLIGAPDQVTADVLHVARNQLGDAYVWGGNGPDGWDCSGLTSLWRTVGDADAMPRVASDQQRWAVPLPAEQALPGDLVFFGHPVTHVGLYTGNGRMLDAAASLGGVVERAIWRSGIVRYGRVPHPGMTRVRSWTPPVLPPLPTASPAPADDEPAASPRTPSRPTAPAPGPSTAPTGLVNLAGLPGVQARPSSRTALAAATNARSVLGSPAWTDISLVRTAWRHAEGAVLPSTRPALVAAGRPVALRDARVGDLVVYNRPASHVGLYLGHGYMVDASPRYGAVVVRRVYASGFVTLVRLG
ncbi:MAG: C40 family peptidase [Frankiales bacterium]|nr:C40 family peptidase [Frankiales bacterium]